MRRPRGRGPRPGRSGLPLALMALCVPGHVAAQREEPLWDQLQERLKSEAVSFGALFQFVADVQDERTFPGENGFSVANFRFSLRGRLDGGFDYLLQSNFGGVLDARIGVRLHDRVTLDAGKFKTPFSREFLTGAESIDFVNRSQSVTALAPGRALGVGVRGGLAGDLSYSVGIFNGSRTDLGNARGGFHGVGRLAWQRSWTPTRTVEVAVNYGRNGDRVAPSPGADPTFAHLRNLWGTDARVVDGPWLVAAEVDRGTGVLGFADDPWGLFVTLGRMVASDSQLLLRIDHFEPGIPSDDRTLLVPGWNLWPTSATELQLNLVIPLSGFSEEPQLLGNLQVSF